MFGPHRAPLAVVRSFGPRWVVALAVAVTSIGAARAGADDAATARDQTLGLKPPDGAKLLIGGDTLDGWVKVGAKSAPAEWPVTGGVVTVAKGSIRTADTFGDFQLHVEFNIPYMPDQKGQARGNSGVYLQGIHELQVLDSYGLPPKNNECGGIYQQIVPSTNACKPPLQWQTYDITFHAAQLDGGKVVKKARLTVVQNGQTIIDDKEISPTPGGVNDVKEGGPGPIMLQDHNNPVQFRNVWIKPL